MTDNRTLEEILEQESPLHNPAIALLAMREAAKVIRELKSADEIHWKTRRTLLRERDAGTACEFSDTGKHECKHCDATHSGLETGRGLDMSEQPMGDPHPIDLALNGQCPRCGLPSDQF